MASEIKSSNDPEYIMSPVPCSGRMSKMAANSSFLRTSDWNCMYESLTLVPPLKYGTLAEKKKKQ